MAAGWTISKRERIVAPSLDIVAPLFPWMSLSIPLGPFVLFGFWEMFVFFYLGLFLRFQQLIGLHLCWILFGLCLGKCQCRLWEEELLVAFGKINLFLGKKYVFFYKEVAHFLYYLVFFFLFLFYFFYDIFFFLIIFKIFKNIYIFFYLYI